MAVRIAETDADLTACYPVMAELRPHVVSSEFVERVRRQQQLGYELAFVHDEGAVQAVAGFRLIEMLSSGRHLYVDDLVTRSASRSRGHGRALLDWLVVRAREQGCGTLELDSGVQRFDAHRFYFRERMSISSYHFRLEL